MEQTIGKRIAQLRKDKGMTQEDLAQRMGVSPQAVSKWENDNACPDISLLPLLAKQLDVSVDELLSGKTAPAVTIVPEEQRKDLKDLMLRVVVDTEKGDKVRVNLPMSLVQVALDMGLELPQLSGNEALKNIDLQQIVNLVRHGAVGNLVDVETSDGVTVHIFVE
ncbi:MAG: helix-turn-helix transcriptional regulator [Oscillospiraceae bacterium]|nr:helix-turn-helix transcriptional regulator [Oscillospiraceae bacterium]